MPSPHHRWLVVAFLFLGILISYIDRGNLSVAANVIMRDFALSPPKMGLLLSSFFWTYALFMIPAGFLVDRWGIRSTYLAGLALWSLASTLVGFATHFYQLILLRALLGLGESIAPVASIAYIKRNFSEDEQGLPTAIYIAGALLGPAIGTFVGAALLDPLGWRLLFIVTGLAGALWLLPWSVIAPPHRSPTPPPTPSSLPTSAPPPPPLRLPLLALLSTPLFWGVTLGAFFYSYYWYFILTWAPSYLLTVHRYSNLKMGAVLSLPLALTALTSLLAGALADRLIRRSRRPPLTVRKAFVTLGFLLASSIVALAFLPPGAPLLPLFLLSMGGMGFGVSNYWALTHLFSPAPLIGRAMGYQNMVAQLAGVAAPIVTGFLIGADHRFATAILLAGSSPLLAATALLLFLRPHHIQQLTHLLHPHPNAHPNPTT
jgi:MFS family permease